MRSRCLLGIVSCLAFTLCGCATLKAKPSENTSACTDWRWIGITSGPEVACPKVPGWKVAPLFGEARQQPDNGYGPAQQASVSSPEQLEAARELARFCVYEIADKKKKLSALPFPPAMRPDLVRFDQDCAALAVSSDSKPKPAPWPWEPHSERFLAQAGKPATSLAVDGPPRVRLAIIDNHPTGTGVPTWQPGLRQHGYTLAHLARNLVCPTGSSKRCAAQITTRLALPIVEFDPKNPKRYRTDEIHGGYLGLQSHLAQAIRDEVDAWQRDRQSEGWPQHLVLNLSLAWDGNFFSGLDAGQRCELRAGTQAVYRALEYAASFDALVLAAAGNQKREPCSNRGPLLPAAWEKGSSPGESCNEPSKAPLVYAVGAVGSDGRPLGNARAAAMPRRAACGENAIVPSEKPGQPTALYSGTSMSTAVVSSIAAVVWSFFPGIDSPQRLMKTLDGSGNDLGSPADFWFHDSLPLTSPAPTVHRLSLCEALKAACLAEKSPLCPIVPSCDPWTPEPSLALPEMINTLAPGSCHPWVYPQPEDPPCPNPGCREKPPFVY
jgi:hypothetical protein